jgi:signal transduction histidine kinase
MPPEEENGLSPSAHLLEVLTRTLRHEVGDLLQNVYSTVAILQGRLPDEQGLERRLLADLKHRAETCRQELDAVVDLVCPLTLNLARTDLAVLAAGPIPALARRFSTLELTSDGPGPVPIQADARRLGQVASLLLLSACQAASRSVQVRVASLPGGQQAQWSIHNDGCGATSEQLSWLAQPFSTTRHAQAGLGLALARRIVGLHGGHITVENPPEGGCRICLLLPQGSAPD